MIQCADVRKSYRMGDQHVQALRGVDLVITEPGFYAIMGQSGSGKSTLLHLLASLDRPDHGTIRVSGRDVHILNEREATAYRRRDIGIVFQAFNLIPTMTAWENVALPGLLSGQPQAELRARAAELLDRLGLGHRADHRPDAMSGGEQQRVAIARALLQSPPVLLADEPTGNLDSASSARLWTLLGELALEREMSIVMVTHEPVAAAHCRRVFVLQDGAVCGTIETEALDASGVATRYQQLVGAA
jgi:putative ABC transport system ATP-binding protein